MVISLNNSHTKLRRYISIGYSTIETKEVARIGYNGFLFPHEYSGEGQKPVISNTATSFVSIVLYLTCTIMMLQNR
jgi:hypothetical protein